MLLLLQTLDDETSGQDGLDARANVDECGDGVGDGVCDRIELGIQRTDHPASSLCVCWVVYINVWIYWLIFRWCVPFIHN